MKLGTISQLYPASSAPSLSDPGVEVQLFCFASFSLQWPFTELLLVECTCIVCKSVCYLSGVPLCHYLTAFKLCMTCTFEAWEHPDKCFRMDGDSDKCMSCNCAACRAWQIVSRWIIQLRNSRVSMNNFDYAFCFTRTTNIPCQCGLLVFIPVKQNVNSKLFMETGFFVNRLTLFEKGDPCLLLFSISHL